MERPVKVATPSTGATVPSPVTLPALLAESVTSGEPVCTRLPNASVSATCTPKGARTERLASGPAKTSFVTGPGTTLSSSEEVKAASARSVTLSHRAPASRAVTPP